MDLTVTPGWWLVPLVATVTAYGCAWWQMPPVSNHPGSFGNAIVAAFLYGAATILSLVCWLAWAVLT